MTTMAISTETSRQECFSMTPSAFQVAPQIKPKELYKYDGLQYPDSIRLLKLKPGQLEDPLKGTLETSRLSNRPVYLAISYVWDRHLREDITLDGDSGGRITITRSLADAMRCIRSTDHAITMWADATCINQENVEERGHQVRQMGDIYRSAVDVLIHLAAPLPTTEQSHMVQTLLAMQDEDQLVSQLLQSGYLEAWEQLWGQPWFSRAWTVQEVGLARTATILYGEHKLSWAKLMHTSFLLRDYFFIARGSGPRRLWAGFDQERQSYSKIVQAAPNKASFLRFLEQANLARSASDPRDRVYAFLAHPQALDIQPDYRLSVNDVFLDLACTWLCKFNSTEILIFARGNSPCVNADRRLLPTWCPAWDTSTRRSMLTLFMPRHPKQRAVGTAELIGEGQLKVKGSRIDTVKDVTYDLIDRWMIPAADNLRSANVAQLLLDAKSWLLREKDKSTTSLSPEAIIRILTSGKLTVPEHAVSRTIQFQTVTPGFQPSSETAAESAILVSPAAAAAASDLARTPTDTEKVRWQTYQLVQGRALFFTGAGHIGVGPRHMRIGDVCADLLGDTPPFILRPVVDEITVSSGATMQKRYEVVGDAYIDGMMPGEGLMSNNIIDVEDIVLV